MQGSKDELRMKLLDPLRRHFTAADAAYRDYLANGRTFRSASRLRECNSAARQLLADFGALLPPQYHADAAALKDHYDVWIKLWDEHASATRPLPEDPFVFENSVTFPKDAQERLVASA
ncbi:MAG: hypothetical protein ABIQ32_09355 [Sphingomicrobium sp.]